MRGLEEIKQINENPEAHFAAREPQHFGPGSRPSDATLQRILEDITGGNTAAAAGKTSSLLESLLGPKPKSDDEKAAEALGNLFAMAAVLDLLGVPMPTMSKPRTKDDIIPRTLADRPRQHADARSRHLGMDGILSAIDAQPPFITFWQSLNDERAAKGYDEAGYKEAKDAYSGGPTPAGSLTFIGKDWDGLRAVPAQVHGKKSYHGEFRQTADNGSTVWRTVASQSGIIEYAAPEAALNGARHARIHSEAIATS